MKENQLIAACRCCLATGGTLRNFAATKLPVMIESFTAIKVRGDDDDVQVNALCEFSYKCDSINSMSTLQELCRLLLRI